MVKDLADSNHLPDYSVEIEDDMVIFSNRATLAAPAIEYPKILPETYNDAKIVAPGYDVYGLEQEWREFWADSGCPKLENPDKAFVGFCKSRAKRHPSDRLRTKRYSLVWYATVPVVFRYTFRYLQVTYRRLRY